MRYLKKYIQNDLNKKMVFIGGPRQVGKTTLAQELLSDIKGDGRYFNWDLDEDRYDILKKKWDSKNKLLIFDELHKYKRWKNWIKGIYDTQKNIHQIIVTGSARLDTLKKSGDSLFGRHFHWRLHPFTLDEHPEEISPEETFKRLMSVGGFPEPFLENDERFARRWRKIRYEKVLKDDLRDVENFSNIKLLSVFLEIIRKKVTLPIVLSNVAEEVQLSPKTAKSWLYILESMYIAFIVWPYTKHLPRAIQKPPKVYFFDNADVIGDEGVRFENLVAGSLLKRLNFLEDRDGYRYELRHLRDKDGREIDFVITRDGKIEELIEAKLSDDTISSQHYYYTTKLKPEKSTLIVANLARPYEKNGIRVVSPIEYFDGKIMRD
ncbi:MAG: hypothetical protein A2583_12340 [Bdellovibrionales bacterium RIFOXYD1_FULL_53_11]|nr:MAG: hypothetical protein A2583_12340 [Bdellovibrionales bacterium RIFOXYD1_FULL_53_11]